MMTTCISPIYITSGSYVVDGGALRIVVLKVRYQSDIYVKIKARLESKTGKIVYETKNYKLYKKNISHWKKEFLR